MWPLQTNARARQYIHAIREDGVMEHWGASEPYDEEAPTDINVCSVESGLNKRNANGGTLGDMEYGGQTRTSILCAPTHV